VISGSGRSTTLDYSSGSGPGVHRTLGISGPAVATYSALGARRTAHGALRSNPQRAREGALRTRSNVPLGPLTGA